MSEFDFAFENTAEQAAYEAYLAAEEPNVSERFVLGEPALVCRWRMSGKHVPLLNRHIRALSERSVNGELLSHNLLAWAKQHIEWALAEGDYSVRDGVLMLVVDVAGRAAMSVGEYEPLRDTSVSALAQRAAAAAREGVRTGVAPEVLCAMQKDRLVVDAKESAHACATMSLVEQLAHVRDVPVMHAPIPCAGDAFLVSDEHGIVPARNELLNAPDVPSFVNLCIEGYAKLF